MEVHAWGNFRIGSGIFLGGHCDLCVGFYMFVLWEGIPNVIGSASDDIVSTPHFFGSAPNDVGGSPHGIGRNPRIPMEFQDVEHYFRRKFWNPQEHFLMGSIIFSWGRQATNLSQNVLRIGIRG